MLLAYSLGLAIKSQPQLQMLAADFNPLDATLSANSANLGCTTSQKPLSGPAHYLCWHIAAEKGKTNTGRKIWKLNKEEKNSENGHRAVHSDSFQVRYTS